MQTSLRSRGFLSYLALGSEPPITTGRGEKAPLKVPKFLKTLETISLGSKGAHCLTKSKPFPIFTPTAPRQQADAERRNVPAVKARLPRGGHK